MTQVEAALRSGYGLDVFPQLSSASLECRFHERLASTATTDKRKYWRSPSTASFDWVSGDYVGQPREVA